MKEVTYEEWQKNPTPRMMWVWDYAVEHKIKAEVVYLGDASSIAFPVITLGKSEITDSQCFKVFKHCAEIEEPKTRRMTNQELAWWLQDGIKDGKHRECKYGKKSDNSVVTCNLNYLDRARYDEVCENTLIREDDGEWYEPLVELE